jgi:hypothetical protein
MNPKLEKQLYDKYPKIFRQKDLDKTQSCMCWGLECSDGWYSLIDNLCSYIQGMIDRNPHLFKFQIEATQVKEKFGELCFYTTWVENKNYEPIKDNSNDVSEHYQDEIEGAISFACYLSGSICESCGAPAKNKCIKGWYMTICDKCLRDEKRLKVWNKIRYRISVIRRFVLNIFKVIKI